MRRPPPHDVLQTAGLVLGHLQRASVLVVAELQRLAQLPESTLQAKIHEVQRHPAKKLATPAERALGIKGKKDNMSQVMREIARAAMTAPQAAGVTAAKATELAVLRLGLSQVDINSMQGLIVQVGADATTCKMVHLVRVCCMDAYLLSWCVSQLHVLSKGEAFQLKVYYACLMASETCMHC